jgi:hypothetical protein
MIPDADPQTIMDVLYRAPADDVVYRQQPSIRLLHCP